MPEDDKRSADTLEEIRDLLIEMRDFEKERAEEARQQIERSERLQSAWARRQKMVWLIALILLLPAILWLFWTILTAVLGDH